AELRPDGFYTGSRLRASGAVEDKAEGRRMVCGRAGGASGDGGASDHRQRGPSHAKNPETDPVPETISFPNVAGGKQDRPAQIADCVRSQSDKHQGRNARSIASGARTNFGIFGRNIEAGFERLLLATPIFGNVKRV